MIPPARLALYAATAGVFGTTGYALLRRPPGPAWAALMMVLYAGLLLSGVLVLRLKVFVDAVVRGPRGSRGIALTFDDGPHPIWTPRVLEVLARYRVKATFFLIGRKVEAHPEIARAIVESGHAVGLHSYAHDRFFSLRGERRVRDDLERGIAAIERVLGRRPVLFRPPIGHTNPTIARVVETLGLVVVGWTVAGRDGLAWARPRRVASRVMRAMHDGAIVLLHDAPERGDREPSVVRALPSILDAIAAERFDVVPVTEWVRSPAADQVGVGSTT